jgi:hypothetical protein
LRNADRIIALLMAIGVLGAVFLLRSCRAARAQPSGSPSTEMPRDL